MADFSDLWDGLNKAVNTGVDAYTKIVTAESGNNAEAQYYKGMNDALVYADKNQQDKDTITVGDLSISTSSLLWVIGGTLGLLTIGLVVKKLI